MAVSEVVATLNDTVGFALDRPADADLRIGIARIEGTFVGTLKIQWSADFKTWNDGTVYTVGAATQANPTGVGVFAAVLDVTAKYWRVIFSAYTSGSARVALHAVRQSS